MPDCKPHSPILGHRPQEISDRLREFGSATKMRLSRATRDTVRSRIPFGFVSVMWLLLSASSSQSQGIIATIAGNGSPAFAGDGGPATAAALNHPWGLAIDSAGAIYISDTDNGRIRRVSPSGIISTVAGDGVPGASGDGGSALSASLSDVAGVARFSCFVRRRLHH